MIEPVRGPKAPPSPPPAPPPAPRTAPASAPGPRDQVSLGSAPQGKAVRPARVAADSAPQPEPAAAVPAPPPIQQEEPSFYRASMLPGLHDVEGRFREGKLEGRAFQRAAASLSQTATAEQDPFVRRKARQVLFDRVQGTTPVADWQLKIGPVEGPVQVLGGRVNSLPTNDHNYFTDESFLPFLDALADATPRKVPEEALRAVAHMATSLAERAANDGLKKDIREKETPEDDRRWAAECASLVDEWHQRGLVEVRRGDEVFPPGQVDLLAELSQRRAAIRGNVVDLAPPAPPRQVSAQAAATAEKILKDMRYWDKEPCPESDQLQELARRDPELAAEVMVALVDRTDGVEADREAYSRLGRLLQDAADRPELRELFRPHLPVLAQVTSPAEERGLVAPNNLVGQYRVGRCKALVKAFPEILTPEFLQREIGPLLQCEEINTSSDAAKMMLELWKEHPETVAPTMELALEDSRDGVAWGMRQLVLPALKEHGWAPAPKQQDAVLAELYRPLGKQPESLFAGYERLQVGLDFLTALEERSPGYTDRLKLPDTKGQLVPARRAMLERLLQDPSEDLVRHLYTKSSGHFLASRFYGAIFPSPELSGELLDRFEEACRSGSALAAMPVELQASAAVLASIPLSKEEEARLDALLAPEVPKKQTGFYVFSGIVEASRQRFVNRELERIGSLPLAERLEPALALLTMARETHQDYDPQAGATLKALVPHLAGADTSALTAAVKADLARGTALESLSPRQTARLQLADAVAPEDAVLDALRPRLREEVGYGNRDVEAVMRRWRWTRSLEALESPTTPLARRSEALELALCEAGDSKAQRAGVAASLAAGLEGVDRPWLQGLKERFADEESQLQAFQTFAAAASTEEQASERWPRFVEVLERVGKLEDAGRVWPSWERNLADGIERDQALRLAMREHALGAEEPEEAREIQQTGKTVRIGGIELPLN